MRQDLTKSVYSGAYLCTDTELGFLRRFSFGVFDCRPSAQSMVVSRHRDKTKGIE